MSDDDKWRSSGSMQQAVSDTFRNALKVLKYYEITNIHNTGVSLYAVLKKKINDDTYPRMSDEKDPVREQIQRDAEAAFHELGFVGSETRARIHGMQHQDPIAWNRCLDAVKEIATKQQDEEFDENGYSALDRLKRHIEKLRR